MKFLIKLLSAFYTNFDPEECLKVSFRMAYFVFTVYFASRAHRADFQDHPILPGASLLSCLLKPIFPWMRML